MKTKKIILLAFIAILSAPSKGEEMKKYLNFTEAQKQLIPYENGQVMRFMDSVGQAVDITVNKSEQPWFRGDFEGEDNGEYAKYRWKSATLKSGSDNFEIDMFINPKYDHLSEDYSGWFSIAIKPRDADIWWHFFYSDKEGNLTSDHPFYIIATHKNLEINGKVYYDVVEQKYAGAVFYDGGGHSDVDYRLFYNKTYGILQIKRDDKNILTLVPDEGSNSPGMIDCFDNPLAER